MSSGQPILPARHAPPDAGAASWYAVQTRARHEKRIGAELQQKGITAFVPTIREAHRWSDRTKLVESPIFSCYVFVRMAESTSRLDVLKTSGVFHFVGVSGQPASIPDSQIESLQTVIDRRLPLTSCGFLKVGQRVRIRGGALDGVEGTLTGIKGDQRLVISVDLIQQSVAVTIDGYGVESVDNFVFIKSCPYRFS